MTFPGEAIVLAGGAGTRLRAALPDVPKVIAPIGGRPFLHILLDVLARQGVARAILATGVAAGKVEEAAREWQGEIDLAFSRESAPLGTGGAALEALAQVRSDRVWVVNGDSFCGVDLRAMAAASAERADLAWIAAVEVDDASRFGAVHLDGDGVAAFREKQPVPTPGWINAGIYLIPRHLLSEFREHELPFSIERDVFPVWVSRGLLRAWRCAARFIDIGTPESYAEAAAFFSSLE